MKKIFRQSCAMPLEKPQDFGTEKTGQPSREYCTFCYQNGDWTNPDISFAEMAALGKKGISDNKNMTRFARWSLKLSYPMMLKKMKRWQKS